MSVTSTDGPGGLAVGDVAPPFALPSLRGAMVDLTSYRGRRNVVVWFSRGFTCPFCRAHTDGMRAGYRERQAADTAAIQVAPNLLDAARRFFGPTPPPVRSSALSPSRARPVCHSGRPARR